MNELQKMIARHEGFRPQIYKDSLGFLTIGYGTNISIGLTQRQAELLMDDRIDEISSVLTHQLPYFSALSPARQNVLIDMAYNLGVLGLMKFKAMLGAVASGNWEKAADEMLDSTWAKQVGARAIELAGIMRTGVM